MKKLVYVILIFLLIGCTEKDNSSPEYTIGVIQGAQNNTTSSVTTYDEDLSIVNTFNLDVDQIRVAGQTLDETSDFYFLEAVKDDQFGYLTLNRNGKSVNTQFTEDWIIDGNANLLHTFLITMKDDEFQLERHGEDGIKVTKIPPTTTNIFLNQSEIYLLNIGQNLSFLKYDYDLNFVDELIVKETLNLRYIQNEAIFTFITLNGFVQIDFEKETITPINLYMNQIIDIESVHNKFVILHDSNQLTFINQETLEVIETLEVEPNITDIEFSFVNDGLYGLVVTLQESELIHYHVDDVNLTLKNRIGIEVNDYTQLFTP